MGARGWTKEGRQSLRGVGSRGPEEVEAVEGKGLSSIMWDISGSGVAAYTCLILAKSLQCGF